MVQDIDLTHSSIIEKVFTGTHFGDFISIVMTIAGLLLSVAAISAIVALIINITKWARSADNPGARLEAQHNMLTCGICLAVLGGFGTVYSLLIMFVF